MYLKKRGNCGFKLISPPPKKCCGLNRVFEKAVWLRGLKRALDVTVFRLLPGPLQLIFHSTVAKIRNLSTRATTISLLLKSGSHPTQEDWKKLQRGLGYLENTHMQVLKLGMTMTVRTHIDDIIGLKISLTETSLLLYTILPKI